MEVRKPAKPVPMWAYVVTALIGVWIMVSCGNSKNKAEAGLTESTALLMCQTALQRAARDPEKASIPYVPNQGRGDEYYFAWGADTKSARMRNGFGNDVAVGASCIVSKVRERITHLTLDGQTIQ